MKVLSHGKAYRVATCPVCNCRFEYSWTDITLNTSCGDEYSIYTYCPECHVNIYLYACERDGKNITEERNKKSIEQTKNKLKKYRLELE